ncbi:MAG: hypothetical protein GC190_21100 [Alphaproteobacteria bacterium]|nr:hypothetical protein [Alphaproteobacteria bacterium]
MMPADASAPPVSAPPAPAVAPAFDVSKPMSVHAVLVTVPAVPLVPDVVVAEPLAPPPLTDSSD